MERVVSGSLRSAWSDALRRGAVWRFLSVPLVLAVAGSLILLFLGPDVAAGGAGILPPSNPSADISPASGDYLVSIDAARAEEGVGPMDVNESVLDGLPVPEQLFIVLNVERVDRGLPPIQYMTAQLNAVADQGAATASDVLPPSTLANGAAVTFGGAIWAGVSSVLDADYYWMYDDGSGGTSTTNAACTPSTPSGCWVHRDIILHDFTSCGTQAPVLSMGAAYDPNASPDGSLAAVLVSTCAAPSDVTLTWQQALWDAVNSRTIGMASQSNGSGYWEAEANGTVASFGAAPDLGSVTTALNAPIVGIAATPDGGGYWLVGSDGGIFSFGDARSTARRARCV